MPGRGLVGAPAALQHRARSASAMPGPSSSITSSSALRVIARPASTRASMRTRDLAHLQALSSRLPSSSVRSPRSPMNCAPGAIAALEQQVLVAVHLQQRRAQLRDDRRDIHRRLAQQYAAAGRGAFHLVLDDAAHAIDLAFSAALRAPRRHARATGASPRAASSGCARDCRACRDSASCACARPRAAR